MIVIPIFITVFTAVTIGAIAWIKTGKRAFFYLSTLLGIILISATIVFHTPIITTIYNYKLSEPLSKKWGAWSKNQANLSTPPTFYRADDSFKNGAAVTGGQYFFPGIIINYSWFKTLTQKQKQSVILHETAHLRNSDNYKPYVVGAVFAVLYMPILWFIIRINKKNNSEGGVALLSYTIVVYIALTVVLPQINNRLMIKSEIRSDYFAARVLNNPCPLSRLLHNQKGESPNNVTGFYVPNHPSIIKRSQALYDRYPNKNYCD